MAGTPTSSRFTQATADALYVALALADAKGDLLAATAADTIARLAVGADGTFLKADSAQSAGLAFAAAGGLMTELFDSTLGADTASIDTGAGGFSTSLDHLLVLIYARGSEAVAIANINMTINNDSGANYDRTTARGTNATMVVASTAASTSLIMECPGDSATAGTFGTQVLWIPAYAQTTGRKSVVSLGSTAEQTAANARVVMTGHIWRNTAAISRLILSAASGNLRAGSRLTVYGIG